MTTALMTYDDYVALPDDGNRYEVIDGELLLVPAPNEFHQRVSMNLTLILGPFVRTMKLGDLYYAPFDVVLSDTNIVQPDILFISAARSAVITERNVQGSPDLVVEILSASQPGRDEVTKRRLYTEFDVAEYWIVDPGRRTVRVFKAGELVAELAEGMLTTPLLPGLEIPLAAIFQD
jgi:Uma2 family endonuclease